MISLSCADFSFPLLSRGQSLALIHLLDFPSVDIGLFARNLHFSPAALCESPKRYTDSAVDAVTRHQLKVADVFLQIGQDPAEFSANDPGASVRRSNRKTFNQALEFCVRLGCTHLTGLPGVRHSSQKASRDWTLAVQEARWRTETCAAAGVAYAIEPHLGSLCESVSASKDFLAAVPGLTITLDYGHFIHQSISASKVGDLVPFASHFHARAGRRGRLQVPFKENGIDYTRAVRTLYAARYSGCIALEYVWIEWNECNRVDTLSETLLLRDHLRELMHGLESSTYIKHNPEKHQ